LNLKYISCVVVIAFCLSMSFSSDTAAIESINWRSYEEGLVVSRIEKKKIFLHFYANWCVFCARMAKETFQNPSVVSYLNTNFIAVRVDTDKEPDKALEYGVTGLPSTWFLTEMGEAIGTVPGFIPPDTLMSMLKEVNGVKTGS
jgi:thioredoxin-related protein